MMDDPLDALMLFELGATYGPDAEVVTRLADGVVDFPRSANYT